MMSRCKLALLLPVLLLAGCATPVVPVSKYLLTYPKLPDATLASGAQAPALAIRAVDVAAFLDGSGIVLQTTDQQIAVASQHRWAEPLERQLRRSLYAVLLQRLGRVAVFEWPATVADAAGLFIALDAFQGRHTGDVVIAGSWRLTSEEGDILIRRRFHLVRPLSANGYDALVVALSNGWQTIATRIADHIGEALPGQQ